MIILVTTWTLAGLGAALVRLTGGALDGPAWVAGASTFGAVGGAMLVSRARADARVPDRTADG